MMKKKGLAFALATGIALSIFRGTTTFTHRE